MGKIVICADHPSNEFFRTFPNCFIYKTNVEFCQQLAHSIATDPVPLSDDDRYRLSWESATERFYDCSYTPSHRHQQAPVDKALSKMHNRLAAWSFLRETGPGSKSKPAENSRNKPDLEEASSKGGMSWRTFSMLAAIAAIIKGPEIIDHLADAMERIPSSEEARKQWQKVGERAMGHVKAMRSRVGKDGQANPGRK